MLPQVRNIRDVLPQVRDIRPKFPQDYRDPYLAAATPLAGLPDDKIALLQIRLKGVIHSTDAPGRRSVLHVVGKRVDLAVDSEWGDRIPRTRIVAIGADGAVDGQALRDRFDLCVSADG